MLRKAARALALLAAAGLAVVAYNGLSFQKRDNPRPLPPLCKKGVFHLHSAFSDGLGTVDEISRQAGDQGLDFVLLTDHGRPNRPASAAGGWKNNTLLIGASEFSLHAGHMAAAGYRVPGYEFPPEAQEAIDEVAGAGGVSFLSHPLDGRIPWTDWSVRGYTGIEILSLYQAAKKNIVYGLTLFPLQYLLSPDYALTSLLSYPRRELEIWDRCNREGRHFGIYALDSHAKIDLGGRRRLRFPAYGATFKILRVYALVDRELDRDARAAEATVIAALRRGSFFSAVESLAAANGFACHYQEPGGAVVQMGGSADRAGGRLVLRLPFPFATDVRVVRDGETFRRLEGNTRQEVAVDLPQPGVYRCEVFLHSGRLRRLPWILANPIFVARPRPQPAAPAAIRPRKTLDRQAAPWRLEKNERSLGTLSLAADGVGRPLARLAFELRRQGPDQRDFWVSLARRGPLDLAPYRGIVFRARGSRPLRFWLQFRAGGNRGESSFQHSFRVDEEWRAIAIPFDRFHRLRGGGTPADRGRTSSLFILIDNGNSFAGAQGELELGPIELY